MLFIVRGPSEPPYIINRIENVTLYEGEHKNLTWQCKVKSDGTPIISWLKVGLNATKTINVGGWDRYSEFEELKVRGVGDVWEMIGLG